MFVKAVSRRVAYKAAKISVYHKSMSPKCRNAQGGKGEQKTSCLLPDVESPAKHKVQRSQCKKTRTNENLKTREINTKYKMK